MQLLDFIVYLCHFFYLQSVLHLAMANLANAKHLFSYLRTADAVLVILIGIVKL